MKKLFALIILVLFAVACSDVNEDVIPDPVTPEVQVDNSQGAKSDNGSNGEKKPSQPAYIKSLYLFSSVNI